MASFTKEVNWRLAKRPLKTNGRLANPQLTSLVKEVTGDAYVDHLTALSLVQVRLVASHYLNQCRYIISKVQWRSSEEGKFTWDTLVTNYKN